MVEIVKHCAFGVPPIIIGHHLDEASFFRFFCKDTPAESGKIEIVQKKEKKRIKIVPRMESKAWIRGWRARNGRRRKPPCGLMLMFDVYCP